MRFQQTSYSCGAASVVNALRAVGIRTSERRARAAAGTTEKDGTDERGVIAALRAFGCTVHEFHGDQPDGAWNWLHGCLHRGRAVVLCTDRFWHWVAIVGSLGQRVVLVDCTRSRWNARENGTHVLGRAQLLRRWRGYKPSRYYGISAGVTKCKRSS